MPSVAILGTRGYPSFYGGFETAVRELAPYLANRGWKVTVYSRATRSPGKLGTGDPRVAVVQTWGIEQKSLSTLTYGLTSAIHCAATRPDVALVMNVANGFWLPLLRMRGIPTVVNVDGIEWEREKWGRAAKGVFHAGAEATARHATRLVFDSHEISRRWNSDFRRTGTYIPYGGTFQESRLVAEEPLSAGGYALMVARFVPENSVPEFFQAASTLADQMDVVIVGSSGYGGPLEEMAASLDARHPRVHWLGHISDDSRLFALWQNCSVYFHGHTVGGTNPALVQAMALGAPVVAVDTPFNREVLPPQATFVSRDPQAIVEGVLAAASDPARLREASQRNLERARNVYSWPLVNQAYEQALRDVIERDNH